jgi:hypothetical protein
MNIYDVLLSADNISKRFAVRYINFIKSRPQNRALGYAERHHILPRSLYPEFETDPTNIVVLTAKEHYIAHLLLYKTFPESYSMLRAFWGMCNGWQYTKTQNRNMPVNTSKVYSELKTAVALEMSKRLTENNPYSQQKIKDKIIEKHGGLGNASPTIFEKHKETLNERYGVDNSFQIPEVIQKTRQATIDRNKDPEYRKAQSKRIRQSLEAVDRSKENNSFFGKTYSEESRRKISDAKKGRKAPRYCCISCRKEVGVNNLTQHTNRCTLLV